jgi:hypothetical protein
MGKQFLVSILVQNLIKGFVQRILRGVNTKLK